MLPIDYQEVQRYVLALLEHELPTKLTYHSLAHTRDDVLPAVERLAASAGVKGENLLLLRTAALFHDAGYIECAAGHEVASARIACETLPYFGYTPTQIATIAGMIAATRMPQTPRTQLEALLADADLDVLGRTDFLESSLALRAELAAHGSPETEDRWFERQITFMRGHRYWTYVARSARDVGKWANIALLSELVPV